MYEHSQQSDLCYLFIQSVFTVPIFLGSFSFKILTWCTPIKAKLNYMWTLSFMLHYIIATFSKREMVHTILNAIINTSNKLICYCYFVISYKTTHYIHSSLLHCWFPYFHFGNLSFNCCVCVCLQNVKHSQIMQY